MPPEVLHSLDEQFLSGQGPLVEQFKEIKFWSHFSVPMCLMHSVVYESIVKHSKVAHDVFFVFADWQKPIPSVN